MLKKNYLLGVGITNETEDKILEYLLLSLKKDNSRQQYSHCAICPMPTRF